MPEQQTCGTGHLQSGHRDLGLARYVIHVGIADKPGTVVVELESPPVAQDGEILQLSLEDGRVLQILARDASPYCRVVGERSGRERRIAGKGPAVGSNMNHTRRRSEPRNFLAIHHPCPRCMANEVLVTHRGVVMVTLYCTACRHGWGETPTAVALAARIDRRAIERPETTDRRAADRVRPPICAYCSTDSLVRSVRRTEDEVYFACDGCEAMWALPRPRYRHGHPRPLESQ